MNQPSAIKEQDGVAGSLAASGSVFTGVLSPTVYRCPNCRSVYKVILGPGDIFLGEGHRSCSKCQQAFLDRSQEWPVLPALDRFFFIFPGAVCGWALFGIIVCALFAWVGWTYGNTQVLRPAAIFFVTPLIAWFVFRTYQILCSVRRYSLLEKPKAA
jgi:hypothetical protein